MRRIPSGLVNADAGRVLVLVVCPTCESVIAVVQERWASESFPAWNLRGYFGKIQTLDGGLEHTRGDLPLHKDARDQNPGGTLNCRRDGTMLLDRDDLADAVATSGNSPRVVVARALKRSLD